MFTHHLLQSKLSVGAFQKSRARPPTSHSGEKTSPLIVRNLEQDQAHMGDLFLMAGWVKEEKEERLDRSNANINMQID